MQYQQTHSHCQTKAELHPQARAAVKESGSRAEESLAARIGAEGLMGRIDDCRDDAGETDREKKAGKIVRNPKKDPTNIVNGVSITNCNQPATPASISQSSLAQSSREHLTAVRPPSARGQIKGSAIRKNRPVTEIKSSQIHPSAEVSSFQIDDGHKGKAVMGRLAKTGFGKGEQELKNSLKRQLRYQQRLRTLKHHINPVQQPQIAAYLLQRYNLEWDNFHLQPEEYDPFFTRIEAQQPIAFAQELYSAYRLAQQHWQNSIKRTFNLTALQHFSTLPQQHQLTPHAFAKELSSYLDLQLNNRDVFTLRLRLSAPTWQNWTADLLWNDCYF